MAKGNYFLNCLNKVLIIHDINLAAKFSNKIALFNEGSLFAFGAPEEVLKSEILSEVYQIPIEVDNDLLTIKYY